MGTRSCRFLVVGNSSHDEREFISDVQVLQYGTNIEFCAWTEEKWDGKKADFLQVLRKFSPHKLMFSNYLFTISSFTKAGNYD